MFTSKGINQRLSLGRMGALWLGVATAVVGVWILATGTWNDAGVWDNADVWKDV